ncbi:MAG: Hsp20/alpha crystallin family protein [Candidatus Thiodiazotropha sp.]|jgi:HSP20 family molecular chaperone IbpA
MNKRILKRSLVTVAVIAVIGAVGVEAYSAEQEAAKSPSAANTTEETVVITEAPDPWLALHADMMRMQAQMDQLMSSNMHQMQMMGWDTPANHSQVTLKDQGDNYLVKVNIPGVNENNIDINLNGRLLSLSSQTQGTEQLTSDQGKVTQKDQYVSTYQQAFTLPGPVKASGMKTQFQNNSLTITIPKATS